MNGGWLLYVEHAAGIEPIALVFAEQGCLFLAGLLNALSGWLHQCVALPAGAAS